MFPPGNLEAFLKYPATFLAAFLVTWFATPVVRTWATRIGVVDPPGGRRIHEGLIPRLGGIAVFAGFLAGGAVVFLVPWLPFQGQVTGPIWARLVLCSTLVIMLGFWDDWRDLRPSAKMLGQAAIAALAVGMDFRMGNLLGGEISPALDWLLSVGWFLLLMNAFNLIDGMDGLAAGLALVSSLGLAASLVLRHAPGDVLLFLALAGACAAFLRYNFHPASIFLGDCGSMFLGFVLAGLSLSTQSKGPALAVLGVPLFAMGIPLLDTLLAVWRRSVGKGESGGQKKGLLGSLATADQNHLHHRLIRSGFTQGRATLLLYVGALASALVGVLLVAARSAANGMVIVALVGMFYVVFRHVAVVELRQSGQAVLRGLARPTTRNSAAVIYAVSDAAILLVSLFAALLVLFYCLPGDDSPRRALVRLLPGFWGLPMIALILSGAYSRVWSLARVGEFVWIGIALTTAFAGGFGLIAITHPETVQRASLLGLLHAGLAIPLVLGSRALVRVVQDFLALTNRPGHSPEESGRRVLLVGPCPYAALFLRLISITPPVGLERCSVEGILDDNPAFHHRRVHGVRVMGPYSSLAEATRKTGVAEVIVVGDESGDLIERLRADNAGLNLHWRRLAFSTVPPTG